MPRPPMHPQVRAPLWAVSIVQGLAVECFNALVKAGDRPPEVINNLKLSLDRINDALQEAQSPRSEFRQKPVFYSRQHFVTGALIGAEILVDIDGTTGHFSKDDWLIFPGDDPERATYIRDELFRLNFAPANAKARHLLSDEDDTPPISILIKDLPVFPPPQLGEGPSPSDDPYYEPDDEPDFDP